MHPADTALTATAGTLVSVNAIPDLPIGTMDPSGQLTKLVLSVLVGIITPIIHQAIKSAFEYLKNKFPQR